MNIIKGMAAGFAATVVLSALMVMKSAMGLMPELDLPRMLGEMMGSGAGVGWIIHFMIGTVLWGTLFALLHPFLPGVSSWLKGIVFAMGAWILMMILAMPVAGAGLFGMKLGIMAPIMTAMLHAIWGVVLGLTYGALLGRERNTLAYEASK